MNDDAELTLYQHLCGSDPDKLAALEAYVSLLAVRDEEDGKPDGTLTVNADSTYRLELSAPYEKDRGIRIFFIADSPPVFVTQNYEKVVVSDGVGAERALVERHGDELRDRARHAVSALEEGVLDRDLLDGVGDPVGLRSRGVGGEGEDEGEEEGEE